MASGLEKLRRNRFSGEEKAAFRQELARRRKSTLVAYLAWLLLGWHYAYVGKWGLQLLYWITLGGCGLWILLDFFRMPGIVARYNEEVTDTITTQVAALR